MEVEIKLNIKTDEKDVLYYNTKNKAADGDPKQWKILSEVSILTPDFHLYPR